MNCYTGRKSNLNSQSNFRFYRRLHAMEKIRKEGNWPPRLATRYKLCNNTSLQLEWEILTHPAYSPDIELSDTRVLNVEEVQKWTMIESLLNQHCYVSRKMRKNCREWYKSFD